ncbi:hypothetical protein WJX79_005261 [Trebouxia sp. C0005]
MRQFAREREIPTLVFLTKIDKYDPDVIGEDLTKTFHSARLLSLMEDLEESSGVGGRKDILPIKNLSKETEPTPEAAVSLQHQAGRPVMEQPSSDKQHKHSSVWVQCENCKSWRRLPKDLHEEVGGDDFWYCSKNPDPKYNSCDVPQELSDEAIDQELEQGSEDEAERPNRPHKQKPAVWQHISRNIYTHRQRKVEKEDDIMICTCPQPADGAPGCGPDCLNRRLAVECHPEWCPCGDQCSNQMFAQQRYAKINQRRAGAKGFGLFTKEDLQAGQFIIEYIGEVLEEDEYHRRKGFYLESAQRHYYFMNVGNGEVIDACRKGALGRFINHSCDPNCETQKWLVHGELAIGLFATKDIPANTELTFDYNFERYGDKPLKCLCGSAKCRGFIGGKEAANRAEDPRGVDEPTDASEEPEPIMLEEEDQDDLVAAILDANVGLREADTRRLTKLAGRRGINKNWDTDSGSEAEEEEEVAETGSKGSMNRPSGASSKAQSDAETEHSTQRQRPSSKADARRLLEGRRRLANGRQEQPDLQRVKSSLLESKLPSRKRARPASGCERDSSPTTSTAARSQDSAARRASLLEGGATSKPHKPARTLPHRRTQQWSEQFMEKRRSEVDRRLDSLINQSSRALRQVNRTTVLKLLRLFNLCDLGTNSADKDKAKQAHGSPRRGPARPRAVQNAVDHSEAVGASPFSRKEPQAISSTASGLKQSKSPRAAPKKPTPASSQVESLPIEGDAASVKAETEDLKADGQQESGEIDKPQLGTQHKREDHLHARADQMGSGQRGEKGWEVAQQSGFRMKVKVKVEVKDEAVGSSPIARPQEQRLRDRDVGRGRGSARVGDRVSGSARRRHNSRSRSRERGRASGSPYSRGTDTEDGEVKEPSSPMKAGPLSARQQARLADLSLLLEVILKTDYARAPEEFVKWGTLRQLHTMLTRCIGPHIISFDVVIRKMLEVVRALPFTADDLHHTRNAHGTFADTLYDLADKRKAAKQKTDKSTPALTAAAHELLQRFPPKDCKTPVEVSHRLLSPRGGRGLRSPGRGSDRGRSLYKGISLGKASTGRIVDWKPPGKDVPSQPASGGSQAQSSSKDAKAAELAPTPGAKKVSPDGVKSRPLPQVMRATYVQPSPDAPPIVGPPGTPHHPPPAQPYMTPAGRFPPAPLGPLPSVGQSQSFSAGQHEVQPYGTPSSTRGLHRLHSVRGPGSPPLAPSPSLPTTTLHTGSRWASLPADGHRPSPLPNVRLPQPPPAPPPSTSKPSSLPLPPPIGLLRNGSYIPVQASGATQPPHVPILAAVSGSTDPPLPSEPAGPLSPDPPLPLSPPPKHPLPPPPERPSVYIRPSQKDFGFPPHLPDLHVKKRKRDVANLDDKVKSVEDISLDEGEIPTDGQSIAADVSMSEADPDRRQFNGAGPSRPTGTSSLAGQNGLSQQAGSVPNGHSVPHLIDRQPELASNHLPHAPPLGPESFPTDWPDDNLTENASFLGFVEYAVRQALGPYRSTGGHAGVRLTKEKHGQILRKCQAKIVSAEQQAAAERARKGQSGQVVRHKIQNAVSVYGGAIVGCIACA